MKKLLVIGLPVVTVLSLGAVAVGHSQALELSTDCSFANRKVSFLTTEVQMGQFAVSLGGDSKFAEGAFLASTRDSVKTIESFPQKVQSLWLAKLVGRQPQGLEPWTATVTAANAFLQQIESASITGDYSGAGSFGNELLSVAPEAAKLRCTF